MNKQVYLNDPYVCPYCESNDLVCGSPKFEGNKMNQTVTCYNCKKEWQDIYTLTDVKENNNG